MLSIIKTSARRRLAGFLPVLVLLTAAGQPALPQGKPQGKTAHIIIDPASDLKELGSYHIKIPKGWVDQPPNSGMRKIQSQLPREKGDKEDGELIVFYFGKGGAGTVEQNVERWAKNFIQPDGSPSAKRAKVQKRQVAGLTATIVELKGNYQVADAPMKMSSPTTTKPGFRMLAAIVETVDGPYYFKATGPERTIDRWEASFMQFIEGMKKR